MIDIEQITQLKNNYREFLNTNCYEVMTDLVIPSNNLNFSVTKIRPVEYPGGVYRAYYYMQILNQNMRPLTDNFIFEWRDCSICATGFINAMDRFHYDLGKAITELLISFKFGKKFHSTLGFSCIHCGKTRKPK